MIKTLLAAAGFALLAGATVAAPVKDYKAAPAGAYVLDGRHAGLVVRVPHFGTSYSVFRFNKLSGNLTWDPANPAKDALTIAVDPGSIATNVENFPAELTGEKFLNVGKFPTATFVSKAFHVIDASHGKVDGDITIMGVSKAITFDVTLVGAGQGFKGPVMGVTARTMLTAKDFGLPGFIADPVELTVDTEFDKTP